MHDLIDIGWQNIDRMEDHFFDVVQHQFFGLLDDLARAEFGTLRKRSKVLKDILGILDQQCAVADQAVRSTSCRRAGLARNREDIPPLLAGVASCDQRTRPFGSLDDDDPEAQSADDSISLRENPWFGFGQRRRFADQGTLAANFFGQILVLWRVDFRQATTEDRDGSARGLQRRAMANPIDSARQTADDRASVGA